MTCQPAALTDLQHYKCEPKYIQPSLTKHMLCTSCITFAYGHSKQHLCYRWCDMNMLARARAHLCIGIKAAIVMWLSVDAARMAAVMSASDFCENMCCSTSCMSITDTMLCTPSGCASPACKGIHSLTNAHLHQRVIMLSCPAYADHDHFGLFLNNVVST